MKQSQVLDKETEIEQITEQTNYLLAENLYSQMNPQKFIDWAVNLLQKGFETENILILAGLDNYPSEEIEEYFWKSVDDLKLQLKKSDFELLANFALYVANSVLTNKMKPKDGLRIMNDIVRETDYSSKYIQFYNLDEDIDYLNYDNRTLYNSFNKTDNIDEIIFEEFKLFLDAEKLNLDDKYREFAFCNNCQTLNEPVLKPKRSWLGKVEYNYWICPKCKSKKLEHFSDQKGKRIILKEVKKTNAT
jgi:hypothetical protein